MKLRQTTSLLVFSSLFFSAQNSWSAKISDIGKQGESDLPAVLKADRVEGDQVTKILTATGNVEVSKGSSVVYADQISYDKNGKTIRAIGNVKIKNVEIGNVRATEVELKDDFSSGKFLESRIFLNDGSYLFSPEIERINPEVTVLKSPIYSICPNQEISQNNEIAGTKRDMILIKSYRTTIDRGEEKIKSKSGLFTFYNIPFFYTPYISIPLASKKRESGFLHPSYAKTTNLGFGIKAPYYLNIAPNMDLTATPYIALDRNQYMISNEFRHMADYGDYRVNFEAANNKVTNNFDTTVVKRTNKEYRWNLVSTGIFDFTKNTGADFATNLVSDRNYLRDYQTNYLNYTISKGNLDYIKSRSYHSIKTIKIQELENLGQEKAAPFILPSIDSHIETKPFFFKEKFSLTSNMTAINREDGLQYRRLSLIPQADIPFNLNGNLFNLSGKMQGDFYYLENNFKNIPRDNDFDSTATNYKPEISLNWRLPLIKKEKNSTLLIEPMASFVSSSYKKNFNELPNEDGNDSELTISNLFVNDRIAGFDRNEVGQRLNYGVKTSFFNKYGEFGLNIGQSYRKSSATQDVAIRGFNENKKSNFVGQAIYRTKKVFSISYSFQLNESGYRNDVNQVTTALNFENVTFSANYILLRRNIQNPDKKEQISFLSTVKASDKWRITAMANHDVVVGRTLSRGITVYREGCCTIFGFSAIENNPTALIKPQTTFSVSLSFKNL